MKKSIITLFVTIAIAFTSFAGGTETETKKGDETKKTTAVLSAEELALEAELAEELDITIDEVIADLTSTVENIYVYDVAGNLLAEQNVETGIDTETLPENAELLMTDGTSQYYIVSN